VNENTIRRYEAGETVPSDEALLAAARQLTFPPEFFFAETVDAPPDNASFRSMSDLSARDRDAALAAGALAFGLDDWVRRKFALPETDIPDLTGEEPEAAARAIRQVWAIGERPIRNMVHLLEAKGARVFSLAENTQAVDAFSVWRQSAPYVFLNTLKTAEHGRMDAAHELAHLALHKHGGPGGRAAEQEAQRFASSFLMPRADVLATLPRVYGLDEIIRHKTRWGVSVAALNYRLHKLGVTTPWQYRDLCIQISQRGLRKAEPPGTEMAREMSVVWPKVMESLRREGIGKYDIAQALALPVEELENLLFMLSPMLSVDGGKVGAPQRSQAKLTVV
jgi:Zn-dependent peptidase ImmA (M78 family)